ncbi:hypothetical protein MLD52_13560 [Puniceicoccaceae bacterium K14]|nr:hypothetical protein [Puniceicoccaceae bacterium K14]
MKKSPTFKRLLLPAILLASFSLSSCAVYNVTSTAVGATTTAVKTTGKAAKTTGKVATGVGKAVIPDGEEKDK